MSIEGSEITLLRVCSEECCSKGRGILERAGFFWGTCGRNSTRQSSGAGSLGRTTRKWRYLGWASTSLGCTGN